MKEQKYVVIEKESFENHAGSKARNDIAKILTGDGWTPIVVKSSNDQGVADKIRMCFATIGDWIKTCAKVKRKSVLIVQYPLANYPKVSLLAYPFHWTLARAKKVKLIYLIHDLDSIRTLDGRTAEKNGELLFLRLASGIVSHNSRMTSYLKDIGLNCPVTEIELFDYLTDISLKEREASNEGMRIAIAGNLKKEKTGYLYQLKEEKAIQWHVYGPNFEGTKNSSVIYKGQFPAEELPGLFSADFGLVWDGDSCDTCSGRFGGYLRFNNPHKLSLYIASGLPVIVWRESAVAEFVEKNQIGFAVDSLSEIETKIKNLQTDQYMVWKKNACKLANSVRKGTHTKKAVNQLLKEIEE